MPSASPSRLPSMHESMLNDIQTAAILFLSIVLIYAILRLDKAINVAVATLRNLGKANEDLVRSQETLEDSIAGLWRRIEEIDARTREQRAGTGERPKSTIPK